MHIFHKPKKKIAHAHSKEKIVAGMRFEDYQKALADEDFAPGWDVIEDSFAKCYPNQKPKPVSYTHLDVYKRQAFYHDLHIFSI